MMHPPHCTHDDAVREAARHAAGGDTRGRSGKAPAGPVDPAILTHLADCATCRETFEVTAFLSRVSADTDAIAADRDMPDASRIWWRARLLQRWDAESRATVPLDLMQRVEVIAGLVAAVVLLVVMWPELRGVSQVTSTTPSWWPAVSHMFAPSGVVTLIAGGLVVLGLMAVFTVHQLLQED
jgi:hypothetical protein